MPNMTLYEFNQLPEQEKHQLVHSEATFLEVIEEGEKRYALYGFEKFYIELTYDVSSNKITSLTTFKKGKLLDKYLERYEL